MKEISDSVRAGRLRRGPSGPVALVLTLGLAGVSGGCRVPAPKPQQLLDYGFDSPRQAFQSFATAAQGELLDALYDSMSSGFKSRKGLSRVGFGEAWDILKAETPFLRYGLYQATKDPSKHHYEASRDGHYARVTTEYRGYRLRVTLAREEFWELYGVPEDITQDPIKVDRGVESLMTEGQDVSLFVDENQGRFFLHAPIPAEDVNIYRTFERFGVEGISRINAGSEWKVDDFEMTPISDEAPEPTP